MDSKESKPVFDQTRPVDALPEGVVIGHYKVIGKAGSGGMGEVFLAFDFQLQRKTALKLIRSDSLIDEEVHNRFLQEARTAAALNHPNIVTIYEINEHQGQPYIAMEYIEGRPLKDLIKEGSLNDEKIAEYTLQIAEGLRAAHERGIVHRDIKPANILVTDEGRIKILDFGLAKLQGSSTNTRAGSAVGTVAYMSPEQAQGKEMDSRSDIFSLGVVIFEMLTGKLPFKANNDLSMLFAIVHEQPAQASGIREGISPVLMSVVTRALEKDLARRYQSAAEIIADIRGNRSGTVSALSVPTIADKKVVAVLPFENRGPADQEYFADGITDEITTSLAKIKGLKVISYNSSRQFKQTDISISEIGNALGSNFLLQGTIRWDNSGSVTRVRINTKLIKADDESYLWAETYDRVLEQIFTLQSEIAEKVTQALGVVLLEPEKKTITVEQTGNIQAYDYYLRGNDYFPRSTLEEDLNTAAEMYRKAIELDPKFALASARLCRVHLTMYWFFHDHTPERLAKAKEAMEAAVAIAPDVSEVFLAQGYYYYWGMRDFDLALDQFKKAQEQQPNNSNLLAAIGFIQRRQGKWQEALANIQKASELDPRTAILAFELGNTHMFMRNYLEAELYFDRAIWLAPTWVEAYANKALVCLFRDGNTIAAVRVFHNAAEKVDAGAMVTENALLCVFIDFCGRDFSKVQEKLTVDETEMELYFLRKAQACLLLGVTEQARSYFDSARVLLETKLKSSPDEARFLSHLGMVYAGLGRKEDALRVGDKVMSLFPITRDSVSSAVYAELMATICTMVGEYDKGIFILEFLLTVQSPISKAYLKYSPFYKPLSDYPRFRKLIS